MKAHPLPGEVSARTVPPTSWTMLWTTSRPTPRPEISVTCPAVENPGRKRKSMSSASVSFSAMSAGARPRSATLVRMDSGSSPRPSSRTVMFNSPAEWRASRTTRAASSLPAAALTSGVSMPWSTAFRRRWFRGASSRSRMSRSTRVSLPRIVSLAFLPRSRATSRTRRENPAVPSLKGRMRLSTTAL